MNDKLKELDPLAASILKNIEPAKIQAQYSCADQLSVLIEFARKLKMYEAADFLAGVLHKVYAMEDNKKEPPRRYSTLCPDCDGTGWNEGGKAIQTQCPRCTGRGEL